MDLTNATLNFADTAIKFDGEIIEEDGRFYMLDTKYGSKVEIAKSEDGIPNGIIMRYKPPTVAEKHAILSDQEHFRLIFDRYNCTHHNCNNV